MKIILAIVVVTSTLLQPCPSSNHLERRHQGRKSSNGIVDSESPGNIHGETNAEEDRRRRTGPAEKSEENRENAGRKKKTNENNGGGVGRKENRSREADDAKRIGKKKRTRREKEQRNPVKKRRSRKKNKKESEDNVSKEQKHRAFRNLVAENRKEAILQNKNENMSQPLKKNDIDQRCFTKEKIFLKRGCSNMEKVHFIITKIGKENQNLTEHIIYFDAVDNYDRMLAKLRKMKKHHPRRSKKHVFPPSRRRISAKSERILRQVAILTDYRMPASTRWQRLKWHQMKNCKLFCDARPEARVHLLDIATKNETLIGFGRENGEDDDDDRVRCHTICDSVGI